MAQLESNYNKPIEFFSLVTINSDVVATKFKEKFEDSYEMPLEVHYESLPWGNGLELDENVEEIFLSKYDFVCTKYQQEIAYLHCQ